MKNTQKILLPSKHLVKIKFNTDYYVIYHSLFGGLMAVKRDLVDFIERFEKGIESERIFSKKELSRYRGTILELKKRHFLIEKGTDDYSLLEENYKKYDKDRIGGQLIRDLRLEMISYCNFRCQHCFVRKIYNWKPGLKMDFNTARRAIDGFIGFLEKSGHNWGDLTFWGGEPLLNWNVIQQTVEYADEAAKNHSIKLATGIITNGSLLNDKILKFMKKHNLCATVSLDGLEKENDRFRKFLNGKGTFKSIIKGIEGLSKYSIPFWVELCLNDYNFNSVERIIDFIHSKYKCGHFIISPILFKKSPISSFDHHSSKEKAERFVQIYDYAVKRGISLSTDGLYLLNRAQKENFNILGCRGLVGSLYVKPSGIIYACHKMMTPIGNVKKMKKIHQGKNYNYLSKRVLNKMKGCRGCEIEGFCAGGCAALAEFYSGDIHDTTDPLFRSSYCSFRRNLFREMIKYQAKQRNLTKFKENP